MFSFVLLCLSGRLHRVTLILKNTKNSFISLLVSIWSLASVAWHIFSSNSKAPKNTKFQNIKISIFSNKKGHFLLRTTWSLILHCEIRRSKVIPCQIHLKKIKSFSQLFSKYLFKNYVTLITHLIPHFNWEYIGPRSILIRSKN